MSKPSRHSTPRRGRRATATLLTGALTALALPVASAAAEDPMAPERLHRWVRELCEFDQRWAGYPDDQLATDWLAQRMTDAGLLTTVEDYDFTKYDLGEWQVSLQTGSGAEELESFPVWWTRGDDGGDGPAEGCAELADVGGGSEDELLAESIQGKAVIVDGYALFNVAASYRETYHEAAVQGATAMFVTSGAPDNLIRPTSSSKVTSDSDNPIPAFQLGADDVARLQEAAASGGRICWSLDARTVTGETHDVVARLEGSGLRSGTIVVAAHYDAWFTGALDNATGVSGLIGLAEYFASRPRWLRPRDMVFVGVTGHDAGYPNLGLNHFIETHPDIVADADLFVNLDHLAAAGEEFISIDTMVGDIDYLWERGGDEERALFTTAHPKLYNTFKPLLEEYGLWAVTLPTLPWETANSDLESVMSDAGVPSVNLTMATPHYHTEEDTPDRIPAEQLSRAVKAHRDFIIEIMWMSASTIRSWW